MSADPSWRVGACRFTVHVCCTLKRHKTKGEGKKAEVMHLDDNLTNARLGWCFDGILLLSDAVVRCTGFLCNVWRSKKTMLRRKEIVG